MPNDIGKTLKECRISAKMSVKEISDLLTQKGYKASESTIYSWENDNSQPTPGALLTMCKAYGINDILPTFGYTGYKDDGSLQLNMYEIDIIEKYRFISKHSPKGAETVNYILNREYEVAERVKKGRISDNVYTFDTNKELLRVAENSADYIMSDNTSIYEEERNAAHPRDDIKVDEGTDTTEDDIFDDDKF